MSNLQGAASVSLREAALMCRLSKPTILRAIQSGKISAVRDDNGSWRIQFVELERHFKIKNIPQSAIPETLQNETPSNIVQHPATIQSNDVKHQLDLAEQQIKHLQEMLDELRASRNHWQEIANKNATLLLTHQGSKSLLKRLFG